MLYYVVLFYYAFCRVYLVLPQRKDFSDQFVGQFLDRTEEEVNFYSTAKTFCGLWFGLKILEKYFNSYKENQ